MRCPLRMRRVANTPRPWIFERRTSNRAAVRLGLAEEVRDDGFVAGSDDR